MKPKWISLLLITVAIIIAITGCGGGGHQTQATQIDNPVNPPDNPKDFATWSGIIAYREEIPYGTDGWNRDKSNLWFVTPTESRLITDNAGWCGSIRWSPDGNLLACPSGLSERKLYFYNRNGSVASSNPTFPDRQFVWLSDSSGLLTGIYFDGIYFIPKNGTASRLTRSLERTYDHSLAVSLDGEVVYFINHAYGKFGQLYRVPFKTLFAREKQSSYMCELIWDFKTSGHDEDVQLLPTEDGKLLIGYNVGIWLYNPKTKQLEANTIKQNLRRMRLSPDQRYLAVQNFQQVEILDRVSLSIAFSINVSDYPYHDIRTFAWSPESDAIVMAINNRNKNSLLIWRINDQRFQKIFEKEYPAKADNVSIKTAYSELDSALDWTR